MKSNDLEKNLKTYRLQHEEYLKMKDLLQHEPNIIEWALFSALWSEHCSYKSSKIHLKKFAFRNEMTPEMNGENAGVVDLGFGEKIAFKMESHNHPSFIEPFQGAATGVGGILRDIFTMGARPIMSANYLCFGELAAPRMQELMLGVVKGISSYGNCVGVPMLTGQTENHPRYNKNILVNALSVGYFLPEQKMALSKASGAGNYVVYVGAKTGRDGVHGASMASASFDDESESKKPNVQIGDPFYEKLLIEACLEVLSQDLVVAMQDMGAAGLTSSSFEMASKGQVGLVLDLKKVPLRDQTMTAEDILLSESQERMLLVCEPQKFLQLQSVFKKWNLDAVQLGHVQSERIVQLLWGAETLVNIDPDIIVEAAPVYQRPFEQWVAVNKVAQLPSKKINIREIIQKKIEDLTLNSYQWIYQQFDQRVGARTASACDQSVAFVRLDHSARGLGLTLGCRPEVMLMDTQIGALDAVYYPAFQLALKGARVVAYTDCLNFGNPEKLNVMTEFVTSVESIALASKKLNAPVISGNVSFYNETGNENIISTPAIGAVGLRDSVEGLIPETFQNSFESLISVEFDWVKSFIFAESVKHNISLFKVNSSFEVSEFIKKCTEIDSQRIIQNIPITSLKAVGLGGVAITCLKMCTDTIGFDLSFDRHLEGDDELIQDCFYSFVLTTPKPDETINFLKNIFNGIPVEIKKIGETIAEKISLNSNEQLDLAGFRNSYLKGL